MNHTNSSRIFQVSKSSHGISSFSQILPQLPAFLWTQDTTVQMTSTSQDLSPMFIKSSNLLHTKSKSSVNHQVSRRNRSSSCSSLRCSSARKLCSSLPRKIPQGNDFGCTLEFKIQGLQKPKKCSLQICEQQGCLRWKQKLGFVCKNVGDLEDL